MSLAGCMLTVGQIVYGIFPSSLDDLANKWSQPCTPVAAAASDARGRGGTLFRHLTLQCSIRTHLSIMLAE